MKQSATRRHSSHRQRHRLRPPQSLLLYYNTQLPKYGLPLDAPASPARSHPHSFPTHIFTDQKAHLSPAHQTSLVPNHHNRSMVRPNPHLPPHPPQLVTVLPHLTALLFPEPRSRASHTHCMRHPNDALCAYPWTLKRLRERGYEIRALVETDVLPRMLKERRDEAERREEGKAGRKREESGKGSG